MITTTINRLLTEIADDKSDDKNTTSLKFKRELYEYFDSADYENSVAVEFGTYKGQTTRILSHLFKTVYTINITDNSEAKEINKDRTNIVYIDNFDLYSNTPIPIEGEVSVVLIDAGHQYNQVVCDINSAFKLNLTTDSYIIFDDYGLEKFKFHVRAAVNEGIFMGALTIKKRIGHEVGHSFGGTPPRILTESEGVITKVIFK